MRHSRRCFALTAGLLLLCHADSQAQTIGTFRWNLSPFCNVFTVTVTQNGGVFTLLGTDDQCGLQAPTPVSGMLNFASGSTVSGTIWGGNPTTADAFFTKVSLSTGNFSGSWQDNVGNAGTFVFNPTASPGVPRPIRTELWAYVTSSAGLHATSGGITVTNPVTGEYCVAIAKRYSHKAAQVTLADPGGAKIVSVGTGHGSNCNPLFTATQDAIPVYIRTTAGVAINGNFTIVVPLK